MRLKKSIIIVSISVAVISFVAVGCAYYYLKTEDPKYIIQFLNENPDKSGFLFRENNELIINKSSKQEFPLASVFKILVAMEYVNQVNQGLIQPKEEISFSDLNSYIVIKRESDNHELWMNDIRENTNRDYTTMEEIVKGMMSHSSNVNTDFLIDKLGLVNINKTIEKYFDNHSNIYPIGPSELVYHFLENEYREQEAEADIISLIKEMDYEEYVDIVLKIDDLIKSEKYYDFNDYLPSKEIQEVMTDFLPASSVEEYSKLLQELNGINDESFKEDILDLMSINVNENASYYLGGKDGLTISTVNKTFLINDAEGNTFEFVFFSKNLDMIERMKIENNIDIFFMKLLTKELVLDTNN